MLKRKREALVSHPSFVLYADDPKIIDLDLFENLDQVFGLVFVVLYTCFLP